MKAKTRSLLSLCLAAVLVMSAVLGTIAYMTATAEKKNVFTVGSFSKPTTDPDGSTTTLTDYIREPEWDKDSEHKLVSGNSTVKDPYVGIGKGSESAYVYVYIENKIAETAADAVYFTLNTGWSPVGDAGTDYVTIDVGGTNYYTGGLFKYDAKLEPTTDEDAWTAQPIFSSVTTNANVDTAKWAAEDSTVDLTMTVYAYIHQAEAEGTAIDTDTIDANAKTWANGL